MKIENVRKCVKCNKTFIGNNNCPYCGSRKIIETDELVKTETKDDEYLKEKRKKAIFKRKLILGIASPIMILIIILCIIYIYIPFNTQILVIDSFDGDTKLVIKDFNLGKYPESIYSNNGEYNPHQIQVKDPDKFYEKYLKQYTIDEFKSDKQKGYLFYEGACFKYEITYYGKNGYNYYIAPSCSGYNRIRFFYPNEQLGRCGEIYNCNSCIVGYTYTEFIELLSHIDNRYYEVRDGKYYLKAYYGNKFSTYLELRRIDDDYNKNFCLLITYDDSGKVIDSEHPLLF